MRSSAPVCVMTRTARLTCQNQLQRAHAAEKEAQRAVEAANKALANAKDEVERAHAHVDAVEREAKADAKAAQAKSKAASGVRRRSPVRADPADARRGPKDGPLIVLASRSAVNRTRALIDKRRWIRICPAHDHAHALARCRNVRAARERRPRDRRAVLRR